MQLDVEKENFTVRIFKPKSIEFQHTINLLSPREGLDDTIALNSVSTIICQPLLLGNLLKNIPKTVRELAFDIFEDGIEIRNHINHPDKDVQTVRLAYKLENSEFIVFDVKSASENTSLIFSAPDFLSFVELAEKTSSELKIEFNKNGIPMAVSIDSDPVTKVQIILSTMQEDALYKLRKPTNVTSYKELMGSYIEQRLSASSGSNTAKQKACSPRIDSFQGKDGRPLLKRKSVEMENDNVADKEQENQDPSKRPRGRQVLSQKEQQEVEDIVACFSNENVDELRQKPSNNVQPNFMDGLEGFRFTVHQSESSTNSSAPAVNMDIDVVVDVEPQRLDTTKDDSSNESTDNTNRQMAVVKTIFGHQLKPDQYQAYLRGNILCENSDSEDIE